ncbi:MAG: hypothetical protein ACLQME_07850 [Alphaproteobacteria bacterium]
MLRLRIKRAFCAMTVIATSCGIAGITVPLGAAPAAAQTPAGALSEAQELNGVSGVVAEIVRCKRDNGVLEIRMRLRNTGDVDVSLTLIPNGARDGYYVVAGKKKYFVLKDSDGTPLGTPVNASDNRVIATIPKGGSYVMFAKYPAPPDDQKKVDYYTPLTLPFEGIPITD